MLFRPLVLVVALVVVVVVVLVYCKSLITSLKFPAVVRVQQNYAYKRKRNF